MTLDMAMLITIIAAGVVLFALDRFPVDKVSLLLLAALLLSRLITAEQAVMGFGNPATITIACMLALSYGVERSGALNIIADRMVDLARGSEWKVLASIILAVGFLSAFINNTAAVALFLPLTVAVAREQELDPSKLLMPMSFAAMFAGTCTLVGTSTNLLVHSIVEESIGWDIGMFEFTQLGLILFVVGTAYLLLLGRRLIPSRRPRGDLATDFRLRHFVTEMRVSGDSSLIGKTLAESQLGEVYDAEVLEILRDGERRLPGRGSDVIESGDILLVKGSPDTLMGLQETAGVNLKALTVSDKDLEDENIVLVEAFISPTSRLIERTLQEVDFRRTFRATAVALRSHGRTINEKIGKTRLEFGDSLLILTTRDQVGVLQKSADFLVLEEVRVKSIRKEKVSLTVGIFLGLILAVTFGVFSILEGALIAVGLMVVTGCIQLHELYNHMSWQTLIMLGCLIPLGQAVENTGLAQLAAASLVSHLELLGPIAVLSGLYLLTVVLTSIMSNNATAVLMVPVALSIAGQLQLDPKPFIIAVMFSASSAFLTPVGYQTNTFIFAPGGYRFSDFILVGGPLNLVFWLLATLLIPFFWPF